VRFGEQLGLRLAEAHGLAAGALHLPRQENPDADEGDERQAVDEQRHKPVVAVGLRTRGDGDVLLVERLDQRRVVGRIGREGAIVGVMAADVVPGDGHFPDAALIDVRQQLAEGDLLGLLLRALTLKQHHQRHEKQADDHPEGEIAVRWGSCHKS
jgi:hypothetical protein